MRRARLLGFVGTGCALALGLASAEILVRLAVGMPETEAALDAGLPALHEPDPVLGWRNKAGRVVWPGREQDRDRPIEMTFWPGGERATAPARGPERRELVVVGCSYTQGWAVSDADTYAWRLQERFPAYQVVNLGTAGYGTHQSLLSLERHLEASSVPLEIAVYGLIEHHMVRNVAPAGWLRRLATATTSGRLAVPYATLDHDGGLERHAPEVYPRWPFDRSLASVALLEARFADWRDGDRGEDALAVTEALLVELRDATSRSGGRLLVAILEAGRGAREHYRRWLPAHGIEVVDCDDPRTRDPAFLVPGYGHPGREIHADWAACIGRKLEALAAPLPAPVSGPGGAARGAP